MHPSGQVFYCPGDKKFVATQTVDNNIILTMSTSAGELNHDLTKAFKVYVGRNNIKFQHKHNAPNDKRIDPSPSNIIDLYILTQAYNNTYKEWLTDVTDTVAKPK